MNFYKLERELKKCLGDFSKKDLAIKKKYYHSIRVMNLAKSISKSLSLPNKDLEIIVISALLHDFGRFTQFEVYHSYDDSSTEDHAVLGVKKLFDENEIVKFYQDEGNYHFIKKIILNHNKYFISDNLNSKERMFCQIIRDADKLDILSFINDNDLTCLVDDDISIDVRDKFMKKISIDNRYVNNSNDKIVVLLSMIYDLNYIYSFYYLKEKKIIDNMFIKLRNKELFLEYFDVINKYIDERIDK